MIKNFFKGLKLVFTLHQNYIKLASKSSLSSKKSYFLFFVFTFPIFGYLLSLPIKLLIKTKNVIFINKFLSNMLCMSTLRFLSPVEKNIVSNSLASYNSLVDKLPEDETLAASVKKNTDSLNEQGYCELGKIFTDQECEDFCRNLENKICFDSQTPMQSSAAIKFTPPIANSHNYKNAYLSFLPDTTLQFRPLREFLASNELNAIIRRYLKFDAEIYNCVTWYNPKCDLGHYVHRKHRDYDDYRFLVLIVYWSNVGSGATRYVKGSHKSLVNIGEEIHLTGKKGEAYLLDFFGLHSGGKITDNERYATTVRWGKPMNCGSIMDGFVTTPTKNQLSL